ncbi:dihydrolipoyl dehydrogenase [Candidatus Photodesmus anomalopis]|uniref:Dihydrolipoyl dehydrogenase n=1 Tax=Candidatus Photodesmus katoptron Akat1 TaxID=1236703 RepID=S3DL50_9GAMM|nr:dihydrolipoyl dehydrogenase [Candidatus Photodesmus katoptron]EPE37864.1 dihydrolipoyl dehydrogenase [Candidatus Photodesmus katoptron Akat1]
MSNEIKAKVVVLGAGPAGYSAAFRCADLGLETILIERNDSLGGVCLNLGCIPSKALLHISKVMEEAKMLAECGIVSGKLQADIESIRSWKKRMITKLASGLYSMAKTRNVMILNGFGKFTGPNSIVVDTKKGKKNVNFEYAIIASGSKPIQLPFIPHKDSRVWDSTDALELKNIPEKLLIIGGGIIGLEMATVYHTLGSKIDIVEMSGQLIPLADKDVISIYNRKIKSQFNLMLKTKVTSIEAKENAIYVSMKGENSIPSSKYYDAVLVAIGRVPNTNFLDIEKSGVKIDGSNFIIVDKQMRTNIPHIYAVGDVVGQPMLAHKGVHQGHLAAEVISGKKHYWDPRVIPSIAYTQPEVAWVGKTEKDAKEEGIDYEIAIFPWSASGRAIASHYSEGMTKLIFNKNNRRIIGGAVVGMHAGELLGEIALSIEMGCEAEDIALTIHAHPTLHESIGLAAEIFEGSITDLPNIKAQSKKSFR